MVLVVPLRRAGRRRSRTVRALERRGGEGGTGTEKAEECSRMLREEQTNTAFMQAAVRHMSLGTTRVSDDARGIRP